VNPSASTAGMAKRLLLCAVAAVLVIVGVLPALFTITVASKRTDYFSDLAKPDVFEDGE
jgi:hypothetical protein